MTENNDTTTVFDLEEGRYKMTFVLNGRNVVRKGTLGKIHSAHQGWITARNFSIDMDSSYEEWIEFHSHDNSSDTAEFGRPACKEVGRLVCVERID